MKAILQRLKNSKMFRGSMLMVLTRGGAAFLGLLSYILLSRNLEVEEFGRFSYLMSWVSLLLTLSEWGLPSLVVREIPQILVSKKDSNILSLILRSFGVMGLAWVAFCVLFVIGHMAFYNWAKSEPSSLIFASLCVFGLLSLRYAGGLLQGYHHVIEGNLGEQIFRPAFFILLILLALFSGESLRLTLILQLYLLSVGLVAGLNFFSFFRKRFSLQVGGSKIPWKLLLLPGLFFALEKGLVLLNQNLDSIMLGALSTMTEVGLYRPPSRLVLLVGMGAFAVSLYLKPRMAELFEKGDIKSLQRISTKLSQLSLLLSVPGLLFLLLFSDQVLGLFGEAYVQGKPILFILLAGQLCLAPFVGVSSLLVMTNNEKVAAWTSLLTLFLNFALNFILIPIYGAVGAAISTSVALTCGHVLGAVVFYRKTKISTLPL